VYLRILNVHNHFWLRAVQVMSFVLDVGDVETAFADQNAQRLPVPFALAGKVNHQEFMDMLVLIASRDAMGKDPPDYMGFRYFGGNDDPPAAMQAVGAAFGVGTMPVTSKHELVAFWIALYTQMHAANVTVPSSAVKGSTQFLAWAKTHGSAVIPDLSKVFEAHVMGALEAVKADLLNSAGDPWDSEEAWEQMFQSIAISLSIEQISKVDFEYGESYPKEFFLETLVPALAARGLRWQDVMPKMAEPTGYTAGPFSPVLARKRVATGGRGLSRIRL
jgi:hypothetical protein